MPIILAKPAGSAGQNVYSASDVLNDSTVSGATVKDALNNLSSGLDTSHFKFNQYLTTVSGLQVYSLPDIPVSGTVQIFLNGLLQEPSVDYSISSDVVTFNEPIEIGDTLLAHYITP